MTLPTGREERRLAFEQTVVPEARRLYGVALAVLDDAGEAEDAVQETMLSAWRAWPSLRNASSQSAWLTRICVHQCLRQRRRLHRWPSRFDEDGAAGPVTAEREDLRIQLLSMGRALRSLSPPQRAMVVLHLCDGFTVVECAEIMGCRPGTARSHLGRAVSKLRKDLVDV